MIGVIVNLYLKFRFKECKITIERDHLKWWMRGQDETYPSPYKTFLLVGNENFYKAIYIFYKYARKYKQEHLI
jgi:hypothetical protein